MINHDKQSSIALNKEAVDSKTSGTGMFGWIMIIAAIICVVGVTLPAIANLQSLAGKEVPTEQTTSGVGDTVSNTLDNNQSYIEAFAWADSGQT